MKKKIILFVLGICAVLIVAAFSFLTFLILSKEGERFELANKIKYSERCRLALWRLDSIFLTAVKQENGRALDVFFNDAGVPKSRSLKNEINAFFQVDLNGKFIFPDKKYREIIENRFKLEDLKFAIEDLGRCEQIRSLPDELAETFLETQDFEAAQANDDYYLRKQNAIQDYLSAQKYLIDKDIITSYLKENPSANTEVKNVLKISSFYSQWINEEIFLLRNITGENDTLLSIQGIWIDKNKLFDFLLKNIKTDFPAAKLSPFKNIGSENKSLLLASSPISFIPDKYISSFLNDSSYTKMILAVAWAAILLAILGGVAFLVVLVRSVENRIVFSSALTHELRTPLTTFSLYTEMLDAGLVPRENYPEYFSILKRESLRLNRLVENVLTFTRIERSAKKIKKQEISIRNLCDSFLPTLNKRLQEEKMSLDFDLPIECADTKVFTEPSVVSQILFNLIDNAAKYAKNERGEVRLNVLFDVKKKSLIFKVVDFGQGIDSSFVAKLFQPFTRSAEASAGKPSGIGLGLAICKYLAESIDGELILEKSNHSGSIFVLTFKNINK